MKSTARTDSSLVIPRMHSAEEAVPLTEAQEGLWYAQRLAPDNPIFNTAHCTDFIGSLQLPALQHAINQALLEADALSLHMIESDAGPLQYFDVTHRVQLEVVDLRHQPDAVQQAAAHMHADHNHPLDPTQAPLSRQVLFLLSDTHCQWYQRVHHLAADGYGMSLIESRALALYHEQVSDDNAPSAALTSFAEVVADDQGYRQSEKRQKDASYWHQTLDALGDVGSLTSGVALSAPYFLRADAPIAAPTLSQLLEAQTRLQISWPDLLTLLSAAYIQRHTGQSDVVVGMPWMGRMGNVSARSVATVMNVAPLRLTMPQHEPLADVLNAGSRAILKARRHGRYRSEQLRRDLGLVGGQRRLHGPLINILPFDAPYTIAGVQAKQRVLCAGPVEDLNFNFRAAPDGQNLRLEIEANPKLYSQQGLQTHLQRFQYFLQQALQAATLESVPSLTPAEYAHWVEGQDSTAHSIPHTTLTKLIREQSQRSPQAVALSYKGRHTDFASFDAQVQRIAQHLISAGVTPGSIVAVGMARSDQMVMCLHGVMAAGAAYLPLDTAQPADRICRILGSAKPAALIHDDSLCTSSAEFAVPAYDAAQLFSTQPSTTHTLPDTHPDDAAYVLYTSGSTGDPKGVVVSQKAIVNRLLWMKTHYGFTESSRFLQKTPYTFDVSLWELFLPMLCGASLTVAEPDQHKDPHALAQLIHNENISVVHFVPSMLAAFLNEPQSQDLTIGHVFCSGEALSAHLAARFYERMNGTLHNLYGPTEAAVDVTYWPVSKEHPDDPIPIGLPVWNTQLYILDDCLRPVPPGVAGALYLGGIQLADGYLGRQDLTDKAFITSPFDATQRLYHTGDLARWRDDGAVLYLGRVDHQIKLRGQRIELGEIESCLAQYPAIRDLAVIAREDRPGDLYIAVYAVARSAEGADSNALLSFARAHLPEAMVPSAVVWMDDLPINANGKLDRKALPAPTRERQEGAPLQGEVQHQLAHFYQQLLQLQHLPYADDDFFALGGHSLLAAQLAATLREHYQITLTLGAIFEHPTIDRLANHVQRLLDGQQDANAGFNPIFTLRPPAHGKPAQPALFCIHPAGGLSWCYSLLARQCGSDQPVYGLQSRSLDAAQIVPTSLHDMAEDYANQIQAVQPQGPYHLLGWSVGGLLVHEIARILQSRDAELGVVAMLDAYPSDVWRDREEPALEASYKALLYIAGYDPDSLNVPLTQDGVIGFLRQSGHALGTLSDAQLQGVFRSVELNNRLVRQHWHQPLNHTVLYFRAALDHVGDTLEPAMWNPWISNLQVHDVPSLHAHLTGADALKHILPVLQSALQRSVAAQTV